MLPCAVYKEKEKFPSSYCLNNIALSTAKDVQYLGVTFSETLDWTNHVNSISAKAYRLLHFFRRNFKHSPSSLKATLYLTNIRPILEYACVIWDPYTINLTEKIERVQKQAARFVTGNYNFTTRGSRIREGLGWKTLSSRRKILRFKFLYNIYKSKTGIDKTLFIKEPHYVSSRRDHANKIRAYQCRTNVFKYSFFLTRLAIGMSSLMK